MLKDMNILKAAVDLARHAVQRQALIAENIANADTPNYKARDLESFAEAYGRAGGDPASFREISPAGAGSQKPNGNNVSLEDQMNKSAEAVRDHGTAIALYSKSLDILRASLGRR